jgi:hypothetical protein
MHTVGIHAVAGFFPTGMCEVVNVACSIKTFLVNLGVSVFSAFNCPCLLSLVSPRIPHASASVNTVASLLLALHQSHCASGFSALPRLLSTLLPLFILCAYQSHAVP